ncbi:hypothetical protein XYCOK13_23960 [Xylanibacillus composti]|uniref:Carrier domain-containing protein n=1 Tax=Xylanibacillus composti TaxID=1572762 RepID=A0A8J4H266_9BACL|nr:non-ribosomal peptide synthetase [Xylanibacillus composti]GIQ69572.1 hypothetical protein XYCOK13_23960 [Xylanibacillus composti]
MATNQKLDRNQIEDILALTSTQAGMLYHYVTDDQPHAYVQQLALELEGEIELQHMAAAWQHVARMNEMLRTVYRWEKLEHPVQIILKQKEVPVALYDLSVCAAEEQAERIAALREQERREGIAIAEEPIRIAICKRSSHAAFMLVSWHHLVFDGWSNGVVLQEWLSAYDSLCKGEQPAFRMKTPFKTYLRWQQEQNQEPYKQFWRQTLEGCEPQPAIPYEVMAAPAGNASGNAGRLTDIADGGSGAVRMTLDAAATQEIAAYARSMEITPAALYYAAWGLLLQLYSQSEDVVFGTTVSGRPAEIGGIEDMVGMFISTVPLRLRTGGIRNAAEYVQAVHHALKERDGMEFAPLVDIARYADKTGETLFDTIVVLENYPLDKRLQESGHLRIRRFEMEEATHYALTLGIHMSNEIELDLSYDPARFSEQTVKRMAGHYRHVLMQLVHTPDRSLQELELVTDEERIELVQRFNEEQEEQAFGLVHTAFELRAALAPEQCAIQTTNDQLTYAELNARANQLARVLREAGVRPDQPIALLIPRSADLFAAMLGVLKAGGAYIPIDHEYPQERIDYILQDSRAEVLVTVKAAQPPRFSGKVLMIDDEAVLAGVSPANLEPVNRPEHLAYLIYTSGSSGKPKGVMVEHRHLLAYVDAFQQIFELNAADLVLQQASCSFDHFVEEAYPALLNGAGVMVADRMEVLDLDVLQGLIEQYGVTVVTCQPLLLNELNKRTGFERVRLFISGGDMLKKSHIDKLLQAAQVYNSYGPTEATVCASYHRCEQDDPSRVPIGRPIRHYRVYVLDAYNRLMPIGVPGEICIAGAGVARGYYGNEALTSRSFVADPFYPQARMYRTGDMGKWLPDGRLAFLGRNDDQVKIRGYRVEPGEIEHALAAHPEVEQAVVISMEEAGGEASLAAYIKPAASASETSPNLRGFLAERLPSYMIPSRLYRVEHIPMTAHAKADKRKLRTIQAEPWDRPAAENGYTSETEERVRTAWQEVLGTGQVGLHDRFFDVGGNSLLLMQLHAKLEKAYGWNIRVADLFTYGTISEFARFVDSRTSAFSFDRLGAYLSLPPEFFIHEPWAGGEGVLRDTLPAELVHGLKQFAEEHTVELDLVLLAGFAYVLSEVSEEEIIVLHSVSPNGETVIPLRLDLSRLASLRDLFAIIKAQYAQGAELGYRFKAACSAAELLHKPDGKLLPLAYPMQAMTVHAQELQAYELALGYEEDGEEIVISFKFNDRRLHQHNIHTLFAVYVDVLKQFSEIRVYT